MPVVRNFPSGAPGRDIVAKRIINVAIAGRGRSGFDIHARWLREVPDPHRIVAVADLMGMRRKEAIAAFGCKA